MQCLMPAHSGSHSCSWLALPVWVCTDHGQVLGPLAGSRHSILGWGLCLGVPGLA
jgi:hypothetical protein